jgi:nucleoside-diphosphate-sugar epimerase
MGRDKGEITLFGGGEETRDHVLVGDASRLIAEVLAHESVGLLNVASGSSVSYDALAQQVAHLFEPAVEVVHTPRQNPETHRHFDITRLRRSFPSFVFTDLGLGLEEAHREMVSVRDA